jgi:Exonuclease
VKAGEPSPLRHLARRPVDRAAVIRRGIAELGDRYRIEVWAWWNNNAGIWEADFERASGGPTVQEFRAAIASHPRLREHREAIAVATEAGAALRWARAMREPGAAVILDTETTDLDGYVVELAVLDAATGDVLLDTLIDPGCPVQPGARRVHGISDEQLAGAPPLAEVWPRLLEITADRTVLAYNAFTSQVGCRVRTCRGSLNPAISPNGRLAWLGRAVRTSPSHAERGDVRLRVSSSLIQGDSRRIASAQRGRSRGHQPARPVPAQLLSAGTAM